MGIWLFDETIVKFLKKSGKMEYSNTSSWRPISLTSHLGKVVERVIDRRLRSSDILEIVEPQFGFQPGKSALHYLYKIYQDILAMKNFPQATVYDLEKTFGLRRSNFIAQQANEHGFKWSNVSYYKNFLSNRKVSVQFNDYIDISFVPPNGLPQEAVLSPLLFIFCLKGFLHDADLTYKYADDSTSFSSKENLSTSSEKAENYTYKYIQMEAGAE